MNYDMEPEPNLAKAVEYYTEALEMTKEVLGPSHEDVGVLQNTVAVGACCSSPCTATL